MSDAVDPATRSVWLFYIFVRRPHINETLVLFVKSFSLVAHAIWLSPKLPFPNRFFTDTKAEEVIQERMIKTKLPIKE